MPQVEFHESESVWKSGHHLEVQNEHQNKRGPKTEEHDYVCDEPEVLAAIRCPW